MKCLSVSQPFADLIVSGQKTIELRSWNTKFRGEFLIHAPLTIRKSDCRRLGIPQQRLATGAVIGKASIHDVKKYESAAQIKKDQDMHHAGGEFLDDRYRYGFLLKEPKRFRVPIPYKGRLGLFEAELPKITDDSTLADIIDQEYRYRLIGHH